MGLDGVELLMRVEEEFGIGIEDEEAEHVVTPGKLCALIERKLGFAAAEKRSGCPTSRAFYRVRRELVSLGIERAQIRPSTKFDSLGPRFERHAEWNTLGERLNLKMPSLERSPEWVFIGLLPLGVIPVLLAIEPTQGVLFAFGWAFSWWIGFHATKPLAVHAPQELRTVGELARRVAWASQIPTQERDVWPQLQLIIADELSVPIEHVTRDADFFRDLGMG